MRKPRAPHLWQHAHTASAWVCFERPATLYTALLRCWGLFDAFRLAFPRERRILCWSGRGAICSGRANSWKLSRWGTKNSSFKSRPSSLVKNSGYRQIIVALMRSASRASERV